VDSIEIIVGRIEGRLDGIGREIGEIKEILKCKTEDCVKCRTEIDISIDDVRKQVAAVEKEHTGEKAVDAFWDSALVKLSLIVGMICGIVALVLNLRGG
jgi:hypothetical protein